ncbi:unnamed protein product [Paramecium primaurelia]|uniref:Uncharacterized protein n=1 Tax=Paramecium primaurelia TaxID=5886 RepID=A0A8S1JN70_PARPR|nr:unnamed protein product [Paramecium primaurelia]
MNFHQQIFLIFTTVLLYLAYNIYQGFEIISKRSQFKPIDPFGNEYETIFRIQLWLSITFIVILVFLAFYNQKDDRYPVTKDIYKYDDNCNGLTLLIIQIIIIDVIDFLFLNFWSILDEIIEQSWQHKPPHQTMLVGSYIIRNLYLQNTVDLLKIHLIIHKNLKLFFLLLLKQQETFLNNFFLMNQLWVPPDCSMIVYRLLLWFMLEYQAFRELHNQITDQDLIISIKISNLFLLKIFKHQYLLNFSLIVVTYKMKSIFDYCWLIINIVSFGLWIKLKLKYIEIYTRVKKVKIQQKKD